ADVPDKVELSTGDIPIAEVQWRQRARVAGRVRSMRIQPWAGVPTLECTLVDATGGLAVVFLGRRQVAGIHPGTCLTVEGGASEVHLSEREAPAHPDAHFALVVDDFQALVDRLQRGGHEWSPAPPIFGGGRGFTRDPAGNRIEVLERAGSVG